MNRILLSIYCASIVGLYSGPAAASEVQRDLASETRSIFAVRCAGCHGAALAKPKGRFGYVLDLARVAANPEMVIPSFPDESELWELVRRGEMPLEDSPTGPLAAVEKEVIRNWIAAGAPANSPQRASTAVAPAFEDGLLPSVRFYALVGAVSAVIIAVLGWIHASSGRGAGSQGPLRVDERGPKRVVNSGELWRNALALVSLAALVVMIACLTAIR